MTVQTFRDLAEDGVSAGFKIISLLHVPRLSPHSSGNHLKPLHPITLLALAATLIGTVFVAADLVFAGNAHSAPGITTFFATGALFGVVFFAPIAAADFRPRLARAINPYFETLVWVTSLLIFIGLNSLWPSWWSHGSGPVTWSILAIVFGAAIVKAILGTVFGT